VWSGVARIQSGCAGERVRVMQWNVLAGSRCTSSAFPAVPGSVRNTTSRLQTIARIISQRAPHILCVQELDLLPSPTSSVLSAEIPTPVSTSGDEEVDQVNLSVSDLESALVGTGLKILTSAFRESKKHDRSPIGCALFIDDRVFRGLDVASFDLPADGRPAVVARLAFLNNPEVHLAVAVAHLKAKCGNEHVRAVQAHALLEALDAGDHANTPAVACGDWNAVPEEPAVCEWKSRGWRSVYDELSPAGECEVYTTCKLRTKASAHASSSNTAEENPDKSQLELIQRCSDYIFIRSGARATVHMENCVAPPSEAALPPYKLPCPQLPSDHIDLFAELRVELNKQPELY